MTSDLPGNPNDAEDAQTEPENQLSSSSSSSVTEALPEAPIYECFYKRFFCKIGFSIFSVVLYLEFRSTTLKL
jgi:hypothetical protein